MANRRVERKQASSEIPAPLLNSCVTLEKVLNLQGLGLLFGKLKHDLKMQSDSENHRSIYTYIMDISKY